MLKGLKLKTKLPDKDTQSTTQPSEASQKEEKNVSSEGKRWLKFSDNQPQRETLNDEKQITEEDLIQNCQDIWNAFITGQIEETEKLLKRLNNKETQFYAKKIQENVMPDYKIAIDKEEDIFESVENNARLNIRNFDPKKSAYLITDIMTETVKTKGIGADESAYKMYKKKGIKGNSDNLYDEEYDTKEEEQNKKKSKKEKKLELKEKQKETAQANRIQRVLANCRFCLNNNQIMEEQILSFSPNSLLILPDIKKYKQDHFYLIPIEHVSSQIEIDDDQYEEIKNYLKCLISMYDKKDYGVVFMETFINVEKSPHCIIEVLAMPREIHDQLPLYFKKALLELESEWATHKKIIEIKKEKGGIKKQIPKNFPYFYIDFDTIFGYAHVIEKPKDFNPNFAHEILGSLLNVDKTMTMFPKKIERRELAQMKENFQDKWSDYDWTKML